MNDKESADHLTQIMESTTITDKTGGDGTNTGNHELYLAAFEYDWRQDKLPETLKRDDDSQICMVYWRLMVDDGTKNPNSAEWFEGGCYDGITEQLTLVRVAHIKNINRFRAVIADVDVMELGGIYTLKEALRYYEDVPYDDGRAWIFEAFRELSEANQFGDIFEGDLNSPTMLLDVAIHFTTKSLEKAGFGMDSNEIPTLDLVTLIHENSEKIAENSSQVDKL